MQTVYDTLDRMTTIRLWEMSYGQSPAIQPDCTQNSQRSVHAVYAYTGGGGVPV